MTERIDTHQEAVDAVRRAVVNIPSEEFAAYGGGWPGEAGTALVDAVFSMQARYHSNNPGVGVLHRVQEFRRTWPSATDDLRALGQLEESALRRVMGGAKSARRTKALCVIEAANTFVAMAPPVVTAEDVVARGSEAIDATYQSVRGLGKVTAEYFRMLLGVPGVKADEMVVRFVNAAVRLDGLPPVPRNSVRQVVIDAHATDSRGVGLTEYEHAIWRTRGAVPSDA